MKSILDFVSNEFSQKKRIKLEKEKNITKFCDTLFQSIDDDEGSKINELVAVYISFHAYSYSLIRFKGKRVPFSLFF